MDEGAVVFSPISHSYPISLTMGPGREQDHDYWMTQCIPWLAVCHEMIVIDDGPAKAWSNSKGVQEEINYCEQHDIPWNLRRFY